MVVLTSFATLAAVLSARGKSLARPRDSPFLARVSQTLETPWAVTPEKVDAVVRQLIATGVPRKIILFGSYVRGAMGGDSDLDVLVVTDDEAGEPHAESARLRRSLRDARMAVDILVVPVSEYERLRQRWDLVYHEATEHGRIVYERPATRA